jgi:hypothetical protein
MIKLTWPIKIVELLHLHMLYAEIRGREINKIIDFAAASDQ